MKQSVVLGIASLITFCDIYSSLLQNLPNLVAPTALNCDVFTRTTLIFEVLLVHIRYSLVLIVTISAEPS